ncbi:MAG: hypothetical protein COX62_00830, partial [Deltaproteobacteria bacterium CG_4_10_14_0_2_um_filter_43_8]
MRTSPPTASL